MRLLLPILFFCSIAACVKPAPSIEPLVMSAPSGRILTIILEVRPPSDSIHIFDIIRGPGRLREDYPKSLPEAPKTGEIRFTFRNADERILKETTLPFPVPNEYEVPSEEGTIERVTLPEETRSFSLRTQDIGGLKWLDISGSTDKGRLIKQRIDLSKATSNR